MIKLEDNVIVNKDAIGIPELKKLNELAGFNKMLTRGEFLSIVAVYKMAIDRVVEEAKEQGIDI